MFQIGVKLRKVIANGSLTVWASAVVKQDSVPEGVHAALLLIAVPDTHHREWLNVPTAANSPHG